MQPYDFAMIAVMLGTMIFGAWKGMAWQIASLASLAISYFVALRFGAQVAPMFDLKPPLNHFAAMLAIYVVTSLVIWVLFRLIADIIDRVRLKEFDRQLGAAFGLAKGVLLCVVITFFAVTLNEKSRQWVLESRSGYYIARSLHRANGVMPEQLDKVLAPYLDKLENELAPTQNAATAKDPEGPVRGTPAETPATIPGE